MNPSSFMFAFTENLGCVTLIFAIYFKNLIEIRSAYLHSNKLSWFFESYPVIENGYAIKFTLYADFLSVLPMKILHIHIMFRK